LVCSFILNFLQKFFKGMERGFFKGMERGFSRIWRIFADSFSRSLKTNETQIAWIFSYTDFNKHAR